MYLRDSEDNRKSVPLFYEQPPWSASAKVTGACTDGVATKIYKEIYYNYNHVCNYMI